MYDFYKMCFDNKYLKLEDLKNACHWNVITKDEFEQITNVEYIEE